MPINVNKYGHSERGSSGSEGLSGDAFFFQKDTDAEKKNFVQWMLRSIYEHPNISETAALVLTAFVEQNREVLRATARELIGVTKGFSNFLDPLEHSLLNRYYNPPSKRSGQKLSEVEERRAIALIERLKAITVVDPQDWQKLGTLLNQEASYKPSQDGNLAKISKMGSYVGLSAKAQEVLTFVWMLHSSGDQLHKPLLSMGMYKPGNFAELTASIFKGDRKEYEAVLNELYLVGFLENPVIGEKKIPQVSSYIQKLAQESETSEIMVEKALGHRRKPKFKAKDFEHVRDMRDRIFSRVQKTLDNPKLARGILVYGAAGVGKTEFAAVEHDDIENRFIGEESFGKKLNASERLSALLLAMKLAGRRSSTSTKKVQLVFDEFEDFVTIFLKAQVSGDKEQSDYSKLMLNRVLEGIECPVLFLSNRRPEDLPDYITTRLFLAEMESPTGKHQLPIIKRLDRMLPVKAPTKGDSKSGLTDEQMMELAESFNTSPRVWASMLAAAFAEKHPLAAAKQELTEYAKADVAFHSTALKLSAEYDLDFVNMTVSDPFGTPPDIFTKKLIAKAKQGGKWKLILDGKPGTGKSEYAKYLAAEIGKDAMLVKASDLLNMWLGGTEKIIVSLFRKAASEKCMIIFEEADSIMRDRSTATQRYEVSFVNEINLALDRHEYPVVFTTNLGPDLDKATRRRMQLLRFSPMTADMVVKACGKFFGTETLGGALIKINDIVVDDFVKLKAASQLVDTPITRDNVKTAMSRVVSDRLVTSAPV